jgi:hypothetical protein
MDEITMTLQITDEIITPQIAAEYLAFNTKNRPCYQARVSELSGILKRGEWVKNGDAIRFDDTGTLVDGQGRLKACVSTRIPLETLVIRGLPSSAFKTIDIGRKRTAADMLSLGGEKNTTKLAAALRFVLMYESGNYSTPVYSPLQIETALKRHPRITEWTNHGSTIAKITSNASMVMAICYLASLTRYETAREFSLQLADGASLERGSPVLALRDRLQQDKAATAKMPMSYIAQLIIHAYNAFARGERRSILKGDRASKEIPRIVS